MEEPLVVSGTPGGVLLDAVTVIAFRWSPLCYDHRLQGWQAFGLLLIWERSVLCLHATHVLRRRLAPAEKPAVCSCVAPPPAHAGGSLFLPWSGSPAQVAGRTA